MYVLRTLRRRDLAVAEVQDILLPSAYNWHVPSRRCSAHDLHLCLRVLYIQPGLSWPGTRRAVQRRRRERAGVGQSDQRSLSVSLALTTLPTLRSTLTASTYSSDAPVSDKILTLKRVLELGLGMVPSPPLLSLPSPLRSHLQRICPHQLQSRCPGWCFLIACLHFFWRSGDRAIASLLLRVGWAYFMPAVPWVR